MPACTLHALPYQADPADYFARIRHAPGAVLLDSAHPLASRGRFDLLSAWPSTYLQPLVGEAGLSFLARLRAALLALGPAELEGEWPFAGGLIGYLAYDFGRRLERLPAPNVDDLGLPDASLGLYAWALASDHKAQRSTLIFHPSLPDRDRARLIALFEAPPTGDDGVFALTAPFASDISAEDYRRAFERVQAYIQAGDCYQVNLTRRFSARCQGDAWAAYRRLRTSCPVPYSGFMQLPGGFSLLSHSPERFIELHEGQVETRPIKGTRPRGQTPEQDAAHAAELLNSPKDRAENLMIVDLLRNDLGRSCQVGTVRVPELFELETYPNVHHMVSCITGTLAAGRDALDLLAGSFPGGSITGAPKIRAMQVIDEVEPTHRALYCGSLLYVDVRGEMDSSIAIRSLLVKGDAIHCWGGGAVVADSVWEAEYEESFYKVQVLLEALG
ncbi:MULTISPECIES: aminodeoxychorismate synthase component I [unclassified Pseudomonas]|uniref:aminodeoxychorismate synthase component I n=1 Tax=unclassified Pseudomonas TaxID=196821 RepID=UPI000BC8546C|nr:MULTISPECIES: aminodeoxychorismate synthase component I [unclassified Pseudomonas]PVZ13559.1 para-aminobenzoate synthetase component 1 [Pseudomonas sp. URIL14HWK12:I12]PVZ23865.1 para-aminobenzoate synthetase component 1 [Pseudomonas sp. URIL14HWK12:I10]PVZ33496.1 para-aminobenzoate synthetase component 1 [Pseudomonas sp. URIL14HWK12:I11]SNZ11803.1 aminodeoxychorismate synthase, subunit I [Pseudomonas sp. URIL14HWK12:I9]